MSETFVDCIFCLIVAGQTPADIVHTSDTTIFFRDINPKAPVHILGIPKKHISSAAVLTDEDEKVVGQIVREASDIAAKMSIAESGFRLLVNTGPDAGQAVTHLHFHLLGGEALGALRC